MIRRFLSFVIIAAVISSCGNTGKKNVSSKEEEGTGNATKVEFSSLIANPNDYVGKNISVEGKVVHVCTESGKKLFIVGENPDVRLFISAGENMPKFPMELLGSQIVVEGLIIKAGGEQLAMAENKPKSMEVSKQAGDNAKPASGDACETESALAAQPSLANIIMEYKSHTVK